MEVERRCKGPGVGVSPEPQRNGRTVRLESAGREGVCDDPGEPGRGQPGGGREWGGIWYHFGVGDFRAALGAGLL